MIQNIRGHIIRILVLRPLMFFLLLQRRYNRYKLRRAGIDPDNIPEVQELRDRHKDNPHVQKILSQDK